MLFDIKHDPRKKYSVLLADFVSAKTITEIRAVELARMPVVFLDEVGNGFIEWLDAQKVFTTNIPTIDNYVFVNGVYAFEDVIAHVVVEPVDVDNDNDSRYKIQLEALFHTSKAVLSCKGIVCPDVVARDDKTLVVDKSKSDSDDIFDLTYFTINNKPVENMDPTKVKGSVSLLQRVLCLIDQFVYYQKSLDRYAVAVTPRARKSIRSSDKIAKRLKSETANLSRVVFLNRLPVDTDNTLTACYKPSKVDGDNQPRQRVGYWKTLSHERFKNHRLYLVEKGVRVRPSWQGDKERSVASNTYRLLPAPFANDYASEVEA